ncbi:glutamate--tRNA ligase [Candidatus Borreliella tachyglossi]|uniref:Glutamate--tRNA ligase n=1 Tax=Candidatus Borreliella tachyglossi TaxID=1964448 RepID=A0A2S1LWT7_9SPIR|nr:glutamate--tRNA ligase [Candidatus Borreliella tachyglossi]AWG42754.1 glutamate--tRNA ligase [Candidatus Borreliella tachyglossi]
MNIRVRYAPSPTGLQHIGGIRTALFNYFFAKSCGGKFLLRVEDTDQNRYFKEAEDDLYRSLEWLGIDFDEGPTCGGPYAPYIQSKRTAIYNEYAKKLVESGDAYYCYCTPERLDRIRKIQTVNKMATGYDRHCRNLSENEVKDAVSLGIIPVIRFKIPLDGETSFSDILLGRVTWPNKDINPDPVIVKSDGLPTYHLANVVDDHLMRVSHVLRAQEWVASGPLHVLLYNAFGWIPPIYCHLPMVMGSDGQKLSKRHGSTALRQFIDDGYLPEAIINYITLLGWSYDDKKEFFTKNELRRLFCIENINKSPAIFDYRKLDFFNSHYIREKEDYELAGLLVPFLQRAGYIKENINSDDEKQLMLLIPLIKTRIRKLSEAVTMLKFFYEDIQTWNLDEFLGKKKTVTDIYLILEKIKPVLEGFETKVLSENEESFHDFANENNLKIGEVLLPIRIAVLGSKVSPPLFESLKLLGKLKVFNRINLAQEFLKRHE